MHGPPKLWERRMHPSTHESVMVTHSHRCTSCGEEEQVLEAASSSISEYTYSVGSVKVTTGTYGETWRWTATIKSRSVLPAKTMRLCEQDKSTEVCLRRYSVFTCTLLALMAELLVDHSHTAK